MANVRQFRAYESLNSNTYIREEASKIDNEASKTRKRKQAEIENETQKTVKTQSRLRTRNSKTKLSKLSTKAPELQ